MQLHPCVSGLCLVQAVGALLSPVGSLSCLQWPIILLLRKQSRRICFARVIAGDAKYSIVSGSECLYRCGFGLPLFLQQPWD
jgi:hypothetical protein